MDGGFQEFTGDFRNPAGISQTHGKTRERTVDFRNARQSPREDGDPREFTASCHAEGSPRSTAHSIANRRASPHRSTGSIALPVSFPAPRPKQIGLQGTADPTRLSTTNKGLKVKAALDTARNLSGIKVNDEALGSVNIERDEFHGEWNYSVSRCIAIG